MAPSFAGPAAVLGFAPIPRLEVMPPPPRAAGRCWGTHRKLPGGDLLAEDESGWFSTPSERCGSVST